MAGETLTGRSLVVGYGNTLRGDDGLGPIVAERVAAAAPGTRVHVLPALDIGLAAELATATLAVFVDARADDDPEPLRVVAMRPATAGPRATHDVGIPHLLAVARDLYGHAPACYVVAPRGVRFDIGEGLTPEAETAADLAVEATLRLMETGAGSL